jgi:hypothetical protein
MVFAVWYCNYLTTCDVKIRSRPKATRAAHSRGRWLLFTLEEASAHTASATDSAASGSLSEADMLAREVDHCAVLGVTTDATEKQLKTAYRMKSLKFHPDKKGGHTAAFQRIAEAYEVPASSSSLPLLSRP